MSGYLSRPPSRPPEDEPDIKTELMYKEPPNYKSRVYAVGWTFLDMLALYGFICLFDWLMGNKIGSSFWTTVIVFLFWRSNVTKARDHLHAAEFKRALDGATITFKEPRDGQM